MMLPTFLKTLVLAVSIFTVQAVPAADETARLAGLRCKNVEKRRDWYDIFHALISHLLTSTFSPQARCPCLTEEGIHLCSQVLDGKTVKDQVRCEDSV